VSGTGRSRRGFVAARGTHRGRRSPAKVYRSTGAPPGLPSPKDFKAAELPRKP
jgi:hypothetical protein